MKELISQGAESKLYVQKYLGKKMLVKERFEKKYRHPELDLNLTKERIKAECRNIIRCKQAGIRTPAIYFVDMETRSIYMEYFENAITVKHYIQKVLNEVDSKNETDEDANKKKILEVARLMGKGIAQMHLNNTVHGDLTTSNMLLDNTNEAEISEVIFIDFGLSHSEATAEDKGVDLYVLERALLSTHLDNKDIFSALLEVYCKKCGKNSNEIIGKFEEVRARGRKRSMVG